MDLVDLVSQLEETKFLRLFRYLINLRDDKLMPDNLGLPPTPIGMSDLELVVRTVGEVSSIRSWAATWVFQIEYFPPFLWKNELLPPFVSKRLETAFKSLKAKSDPVAFLRSSEPDDYSGSPLDYYFFTNMCYDLDDEALSWFSDRSHQLFEEILGVPRKEHPTFGIGTPQTAFRENRSAVERFIVDLLSMPSSYYFLAREGRVTVVPSVEHGAFFASADESRFGVTNDASLGAVVTSSLAALNRSQFEGLTDLQNLINSPATKEADLQEFFRANPHFLFALDERYCEIRPHVCLVDDRRNRQVPDFMARIQGRDIWDVIELKRPQHILLSGAKELERASAVAARGISELLQNRDFFASRSNRRRVADRFGTVPYEPALILVIGRGSATQRFEWESAKVGFPRVQVVSYDYLFQRAQECRAYIDKALGLPNS